MNPFTLNLLKHIYAQVDLEGKPVSLHCSLIKDGAGVDFCLTQDKTLEVLIEAKRSDTRPSRALINFSRRYDIPATQLVLHLKRERMDRGIRLVQGMKYLELKP